MKTNFDQFENDRMIVDPKNYKAGIFYFNPKDSRIMIPKRYKLTGWTLNFAKLYTYYFATTFYQPLALHF